VSDQRYRQYGPANLPLANAG